MTAADQVRRRQRYGVVPAAVIEHLGHGAALSVYVALTTYAAPDGTNAYPLQDTLAKQLRVSTDTVQRALKELKRAGLVEIGTRKEGTRKLGNIYTITDDFGCRTHAASVSTENRTHAALDDAAPMRLPIPFISCSDEQNIAQPSCASSFDAFWSAYPRKVDKQRARREYQARIRQGIDPSVLERVAKSYAEACARASTETAFIKHPSTFLHGAEGPWSEWANGSANVPRPNGRRPPTRDDQLLDGTWEPW